MAGSWVRCDDWTAAFRQRAIGRRQHIVTVGYDHKHNVLIVRVGSHFRPDTMALMDDICATFLEAEGPAHAIFDFSTVSVFEMTGADLGRRAARPALCPGFERIVVAPRDDIFALARRFRDDQAASGLPAPLLVRSMAEVLPLLGLETLAPKELDKSWLLSPRPENDLS